YGRPMRLYRLSAPIRYGSDAIHVTRWQCRGAMHPGATERCAAEPGPHAFSTWNDTDVAGVEILSHQPCSGASLDASLDASLGGSIRLTCAATTRQPSGQRTQVCIWRPMRPGAEGRW